MRRPFAVIVSIAVIAAACSGGDGTEGSSAGTTGDGSTSSGAETTGGTAPQACPETTPLPPATANQSGPAVDRTAGVGPVPGAVEVSTDAFLCAADVVVVAASDVNRAALAARLAGGLGGPLLYGSAIASPVLDAEIARLAPQRVYFVGNVVAALPEWTEAEALPADPALLAAEVNRRTGGAGTLALPDDPGPATVARTVEAIDAGFGLAPPITVTTTTTDPSAGAGETTTTGPIEGGPEQTPDDDTEALPVVHAGDATSGRAWLVDVDRIDLALAAGVAAEATGGFMGIVDGRDLRRVSAMGRELRSASPAISEIHLVGELTDDADWQLDVLLEAVELPGGGWVMFPGRRLVAFYGNPLTGALGVLGETGPEEAVERLREVAAPYGADGLQVLPTFEIIATVASADAGFDGDYSNEMDLDVLQPWVDAAKAAGYYTLLDLQPGRTDFLTQAKRYEQLLLDPWVGLALDPEWRLEEDQFHLQQIGSVSADEVNEVVEWLATLTREAGLPQKMLLLHQFRSFMLQDRETIETPSELAVVIQMDGHGQWATKMETWGILTEGTAATQFHWGFKNFYDEDVPTPIPEQVIPLRPVVVYVSYQ